MERQDLEGNSPVIEVLEGQMSVEELLADLGFEWEAGPAAANSWEEPAEDPHGQPALF
jgi:hypothetical protein